MKKLKAGIFNGHQIRKLMKNPMSDDALTEAEPSAWQTLKSVVTNFQRHNGNVEYRKEIEKKLKSFRQLAAQSNYTLCGYTWTIFQRIVKI